MRSAPNSLLLLLRSPYSHRRSTTLAKPMAALALLLFTSVLLLASTPLSSSYTANSSWPEYPALQLTSESTVVIPLQFSKILQLTYYVPVMIGKPPKQYDMDIDTGSDLTVVNCKPKSNDVHPPYEPDKDKVLQCKDPRCEKMHKDIGMKHDCTKETRCLYKVEYADGSVSKGLIVSDLITLTLKTGATIQAPFLFGCETSHEGDGHAAGGMDGLLGLGRTPPSLMSQLRGQGGMKNILGHCLARGRSPNPGGSLFLGNADQIIPSGTTVSWANMQLKGEFYSMETRAFFLGDKQLPGTDRKVQTLLDTGSMFTYFVGWLYKIFVAELTKDLSNGPLKKLPQADPVCWKGDKPFTSLNEAAVYFKKLAFSFTSGSSTARMEILPKNYLGLSKGNVCLAINEEEDDDENLIGVISLQDVLVIYDNEKERIGWVSPVDCSKPLGEAASPI